jgi:hypothetical protein
VRLVHLAIHLESDFRGEEVIRIFVKEGGDEPLGSQVNIFGGAVGRLNPFRHGLDEGLFNAVKEELRWVKWIGEV